MPRRNAAGRPPDWENRPARHITAAAPAERHTTVCIVAHDLAVAVDLIADQGERERQAYDRGRFHGFADGWTQGLTAGLERGAA